MDLPARNGLNVDAWKNEFYRVHRVQNFLMRIAGFQLMHCHIDLPYLSRNIQGRFANTGYQLKSAKRLVRDALTVASPGDILRIPLATQKNWKSWEPFLSLPDQVMGQIATELRSSELAGLVDMDSLLRNREHWRLAGSHYKWNVGNIVRKVHETLGLGLRGQQLFGLVPFPKLQAHMLVKRLWATHVFLTDVRARF